MVGTPDTKLWDRRFAELENFKEEHRNCNVPRGYPENPKLGRWVNNQRYLHSKGKLVDNRFKRLEEIGFSFGNDRGARWNDRFKELEKYKEEHGHCKVPNVYPGNPGLGRWVADHRHMKKRGTLSDERQKLLDSVGFLWDGRNPPAPVSDNSDAVGGSGSISGNADSLEEKHVRRGGNDVPRTRKIREEGKKEGSANGKQGGRAKRTRKAKQSGGLAPAPVPATDDSDAVDGSGRIAAWNSNGGRAAASVSQKTSRESKEREERAVRRSPQKTNARHSRGEGGNTEVGTHGEEQRSAVGGRLKVDNSAAGNLEVEAREGVKQSIEAEALEEQVGGYRRKSARGEGVEEDGNNLLVSGTKEVSAIQQHKKMSSKNDFHFQKVTIKQGGPCIGLAPVPVPATDDSDAVDGSGRIAAWNSNGGRAAASVSQKMPRESKEREERERMPTNARHSHGERGNTEVGTHGEEQRSVVGGRLKVDNSAAGNLEVEAREGVEQSIEAEALEEQVGGYCRKSARGEGVEEDGKNLLVSGTKEVTAIQQQKKMSSKNDFHFQKVTIKQGGPCIIKLTEHRQDAHYTVISQVSSSLNMAANEPQVGDIIVPPAELHGDKLSHRSTKAWLLENRPASFHVWRKYNWDNEINKAMSLVFPTGDWHHAKYSVRRFEIHEPGHVGITICDRTFGGVDKVSVVEEVAPNSLGEKVGVKKRDIIFKTNNLLEVQLCNLHQWFTGMMKNTRQRPFAFKVIRLHNCSNLKASLEAFRSAPESEQSEKPSKSRNISRTKMTTKKKTACTETLVEYYDSTGQLLKRDAHRQVTTEKHTMRTQESQEKNDMFSGRQLF